MSKHSDLEVVRDIARATAARFVSKAAGHVMRAMGPDYKKDEFPSRLRRESKRRSGQRKPTKSAPNSRSLPPQNLIRNLNSKLPALIETPEAQPVGTVMKQNNNRGSLRLKPEKYIKAAASGWEKGQVENQVGLVRERFQSRLP